MPGMTTDTNSNDQAKGSPAGQPPTEKPLPPMLQSPDLSTLKVSQDFGAMAGVKKVLNTIPICKPAKTHWVRVFKDLTWRINLWILVYERDMYIVAPQVASLIPGEVKPMELVPTITRQGTLSLWPVRLPGPDGRIDTWSASAREAVGTAIDNWVRISANMNGGFYETFIATASIPDPEWPDLTFDQMVNIAIKGKVINTEDHPILRTLRGEL
jgi:hypothetical protein